MSKNDDLKDRLDELFSSPQPGGEVGYLVVPEPAAEQEKKALPGSTESIFDNAFENASIGMVVTGIDTHFVRVNDAFAGMLGYAPDEVIGQSFQTLTYTEDLEVGAQAMRDLLSGKTTIANIQKRYVHKDGHLIWVDLNITLLLDEEGKPRHFITFVQDITEQKHTDLLLEKRVRELNCLNEIGHKMDEKPALPDFLEWVTSRVPQAFQYPDVCVASIEYENHIYGSSEAQELESAMVGGLRLGGELVGWLRVAYTEPREFIDAESALLGGIISRVTSYIESTQLLEQRTTALLETDELSVLQNAILQSAAYAIISTTPEGIITAFNPAAERMLGYSAYELIGKQTPGVFHDPEEVVQRAKLFSSELGYTIEPGFEVFVAKARHGLENEYEWTYISKKGERIPVRLSVTALRDPEGNISGFLGLATDITERKETEKALEKQATEMATVAEVSTAAATILRPDELLRSVVNLTKERFGLYHAHIYQLNEDKAALVLTSGAGEAGEKMVNQGWRIAIESEQSLVARAGRERKGIIVNDVRADPGFLANEFLPSTASEMAVPMIVGNDLLGVLDVQSDQTDYFSEQDIVVFTTLAQQVAVALQNANQYEHAHQALAVAETLYAGSAWITSANTMEKILQALIGATPLKKLDRANLAIFDRSWQVESPAAVTVEATWDKRGRVARTPVGTRYELDQFAVFPLLNREQPTIVADTRTDGRLDDELRSTLIDRGVCSVAIFPLKAAGEWIGAVVGEADRNVTLEVEEVRRINSLIDQAATIAQNLRLVEQANQAQARMQDILNAVTTPMLISRVSDGRIVYANSLVADMVRTPLDTFVGGRTPNFYAVAKDREVIVDQIQKQGGVANYELRLRRNDGEEFWALLSARLLDYQGEPAIITSLIDVTDRKTVQEAVAKQARELATVAKVGTTIASVLDPNELLQSVVDLTKESFDLYHAHIYLIDSEKEALVLSAGAFEVGRMMVAEGWEIPIHSKRSLVTRAARDLKGIIVNDVSGDPHFLPNELLPETASEMAVPLVIGDQLLGVLDVQSDEKDHFSEEDVSIFTTLASQVAVALQNARQYEQTQYALMSTEQSQQLLRSIIDATPDWIFIKDKEHRYRLANKGYADALHMQPDDFIGKNDLELGFPEELVVGNPEKGIRGFWADDRLVIESGEAQIYPNDPATIDGEVHIFHTYKTPLVDENQDVWGVLAFSRDITEREQLLRETQELYTGSASIIAADSAEDLLLALVENTVLRQLDRASIAYFDQPWDETPPNSAVTIAAWERSGEAPLNPVGSSIPVLGNPVFGGVQPGRPSILLDVTADKNLDQATKDAMAAIGMRASLIMPLVAGDVWFGVLSGQSLNPLKIGEEDLRRFSTLVDQSATVIQSLRLQNEMRERVSELTILQRMMSREAWASYQAQARSESMGYVFDRVQVKPLSREIISEPQHGNNGRNPEVDVLADALKDVFSTTLAVRGEPIGVLGVREESGYVLSQNDEAFLLAVSEQVAQAMERARLIEQTQKAAVELQAVADVSTATSTILHPEELLQSVVDLTKRNFGLYHAHIYLLDDMGKSLYLAVGAGDIGRSMVSEGWGISLDEENSLVASVARNRLGKVIADVRQFSGYMPNPMLPDTLSELAVPMIVGDTLLGVFDVQSDIVAWFTEDEDVSVYGTLASQVAIALQNAKLYAEQLETVERLRELDNMKSAFLANMSHELRTPLNSILGFTQVIQEGLDGPLTDLMVSDLELIEKNGKHLLNLINDVLDMAKIEAGRLTLSPEPLSLYELLEDVIVSNGLLARDKNLYLNLEAEPDVDWTVVADHVRMRQIFINLIGNSIKFTEEGGITVEFEKLAAASELDKNYVQVRVCDTGVGIPPERLEDIFEAFSQVDSTTTRKAGGTGLGLPISRRLVEMHGGKLWAESKGIAGQGSVFYLELPIEN